MQNLDISKTKWDLSYLFNDDNDPKIEENKQEIAKDIRAFCAKWKNRTDYLSDTKVLVEVLSESESLSNKHGSGGKAGFYLYLRTAQDKLDPKLKAKSIQYDELILQLMTEMQFVSLRLARAFDDFKTKALNSPELSEYTYYLKKLFDSSKHLLSEDAEKILLLKMPTSFSNWVEMTSKFLSAEQREVLTDDGSVKQLGIQEILNLLKSHDKKIRDGAAEKANQIFEKHLDVAAEEINSIIYDKKIDDQLRGYERADQSTLIGDDIQINIVDCLLDSVSARFDQSARFHKLKAKLLGLEKLDYQDRYTEMLKNAEEFDFAKSAELVYTVFDKLDPYFSKTFKSYLENGQFDVFPQKGKSSGGFCIGDSKNNRIHVLLNHTGALFDVSTIAHEMGHAINFELMRAAQNAFYQDTALATAEVASTFFEDFVLLELLEKVDDETRLGILMEKLQSDISSIHRQVACYKFEQDLHKTIRDNGYMSKEEIGLLFQKHMAAYMGEYVNQNPGSQNWWVYWSHIRRFFYVYSYASGLLISKSLQASVKKDPAFISKIKEFLAAGTSDSPQNIFLKLGIDITDKNFWTKGLSEIDALLDETEALAKKLGKL